MPVWKAHSPSSTPRLAPNLVSGSASITRAPSASELTYTLRMSITLLAYADLTGVLTNPGIRGTGS